MQNLVRAQRFSLTLYPGTVLQMSDYDEYDEQDNDVEDDDDSGSDGNGFEEGLGGDEYAHSSGAGNGGEPVEGDDDDDGEDEEEEEEDEEAVIELGDDDTDDDQGEGDLRGRNGRPSVARRHRGQGVREAHLLP